MLAGVAGVSAAAAVVPAQAQEGEEPVAVFNRPREGLDPKGLDLGAFRLFPSLTVSETYDDNIFADEDGKEADFITSITGGAQLRSEWTRHDLTFDTRVRHQKFLDNDEQDRTEYFLRPTMKFDLGGRDRAVISAEHSRRAIGRSDPEEDDDEKPTQFNRFAVGGEYIHRINRVFFGLEGEARRDDYFTSGDDVRDRIEYRFGLPVGYEVSAKTDVKVEPFVRRRDFDEDNSAGADRDSVAAGALVGIDTELSPLLDLNFDVGFIANDFDDPRFDSRVDLIFAGEAIWYATPRTTVFGRAARRDLATSTSNASSKTQTSAGLEVQQELQRDLLLRVDLLYFNDDFHDDDRADDRANASIELEYLLNRNLSLVTDVRHEERWSNVEGEDFSRNLITLGFRARF
ncbi:MAG: outer membrane beta-barrel protein [Kiloniellaceae bacterium]|nr:outer membrane beta-barrel protein [Kiloniellaceae bacterium]